MKNTIFYLIALVMLALGMILFVISTTAKAGGPWSDQYCDISHETVITKNQKGEIIDKVTKEIVKCEDGVKDFLHGAGIAKNCQFFTWKMPYKGTMIDQRSIACEKIDGGWEIVQGYHYIN